LKQQRKGAIGNKCRRSRGLFKAAVAAPIGNKYSSLLEIQPVQTAFANMGFIYAFYFGEAAFMLWPAHRHLR
jgi:hypothetical protein